jgi:hypothetical protein
VHVVAFGVHEPTVLVTGMQTSEGTGALRGATPPSDAGVAVPLDVVPVPLVATPMPLPPLPAQPIAKEQVKPSPQSASALQASCHLYSQVETLTVVQVGGVVGTKHSAFAGHVAVPPEHCWWDSV